MNPRFNYLDLQKIDSETLQLIDEIQGEHRVWHDYNFGGSNRESALLGLWEEGGELAHSFLKLSLNIRGGSLVHYSKMVDAIGDCLLFLLSYLSKLDTPFVTVYLDRPTPFAASRPYSNFGLLHATSELIQHHEQKIGESEFTHSFAMDEMKRRAWQVYLQLAMFASHHLSTEGVSLTAIDCLTAAWRKVKTRDWKAAPVTGQA